MDDVAARLREALSDQYSLTEELGHGGMAVVYLAHDLKHDRDVALKVLRPELAASLGRERFLREIRVTAKLSHPHIVPLYDSGEAGGLLYYVMPFVEGESLRDLLDRERQISIEDAVRIAREVAEALDYAHNQDIIHRDIKPENILLSAGGHALVADFGIAGALSAAGADRLTSTGMTLGTPAYMSPEQGAGEDPDARSDLYGLGCVLYEMLAGQPPFSGSNAQATLARHAVDEVPSIRAVRPTTPPELEELVFHSLAKSPADRFKSGERLVEALNAIDPTPLHTGSGLVATRRRRSPGRWSRFAPWAAAAVVLALVAGWLGSSLIGNGSDSDSTLGGLDPNRIAILYLEDATPAGELGLLAAGLTEGLIDRLSLVPALDVISRNGVARFAGSTMAPEDIAGELSAGTLVKGSIGLLGDSLRTTLRLLDGESGVDIESGAFTIQRGEFLAVRDSLTGLAEELIRRRLGEEVRVRTERSQARNDEAWLLLQRGQRLRASLDSLNLEGDSAALQAAYQQADSLFALAEELDPEWSEPTTRRAWMEFEHARWVGTTDPLFADRWTGVGLEHVARALAMDTLNPNAFEARGILRYWRWLMGLEPDRDASRVLFESAEEDLRTAIALNGRQASAYATLSHLLVNKSGGRGVMAEARLAAERAMEADAYLENADVVIRRLCLISYDLEEIVRASRWCREGADRFPEDPYFVECQILLMTFDSAEPDVDEAWRLAQAYLDLQPPSVQDALRLRANMLVAAVIAQAGLADSATVVIERSRGDPSLDPNRELLMFGAFAYTRMEKYDEAVGLLTEFISANPVLATDITTDDYWWWRDLQDHEGFRALAQLGGELGG